MIKTLINGIDSSQISETDAKRHYAFLLDLQNSSPEPLKGKIKEFLRDSFESRLEGSLTNSPIGSQHWYNTLLTTVLHVGEFMQDRDMTEKQRKAYGANLQKIASHLLINYDKIPYCY